MLDKQSNLEDPEVEPQIRDAQRQSLLLALIEHGSRPLVYLLVGLGIVFWLFAARQPLLDLLKQTERLRIGSLEIQIRADALSGNVDAQLRALRLLDDEQLQLFLVIGKKRRGMDIDYKGEEVSEPNLEALRKAGLLSEIGKTQDDGFRWRVSDEGYRLHDIVRSHLFLSIRRSAAP